MLQMPNNMKFNIDINEILRYMNISNKDHDILKIVQHEVATIDKIIMPKYTFIKTKIAICENGIKIGNSDIILKGNDIKNHLNNCSECYIICGTLGASIDRHIKLLESVSMLSAMTSDAACADFIEKLLDNAQKEIGNIEAENGRYITSRYSPGYGDLPISLQKSILTICDAPKKIGLNVTETNILIPRKSVTAIIGVSSSPVVGKTSGCASCNMIYKCQFRKAGKTCET